MRSVRCTVMLRDGSKCDMKHWSIFMLHAQRVARFRYFQLVNLINKKKKRSFYNTSLIVAERRRKLYYFEEILHIQ